MDQVIVVVGALLNKLLLKHDVPLFCKCQEEVKHIELSHLILLLNAENVRIHIADKCQDATCVFIAADSEFVGVFQGDFP